MSYREVSEVRDGMRIDWDMPIKMDDGLVLRADIYRPIEPGKYPVILNYGPYGKWLLFQDGYKSAWQRMADTHPDVATGSTNKYQSWEVVDPEKWVPAGYACVRVDSRGAGRSPGYMDLWSPRETQDFAACIEWAGEQPWSNGKVGLNGISYYAMNQWQVACLKPQHLAAMCVWEGAADFYRDVTHHGGILSTFLQSWYDIQARPVQHGHGIRGYRSHITGDWVTGPETLTTEELGANRSDLGGLTYEHAMDDEFWEAKCPDWSKVTVPMLSASNWGGISLHPRGNIEGYVRSASKQKWLEVHGLEHYTHFYTDYGRNIQKRFFDYFLKGEKNGWDKEPKVRLQVRHPGEKFVERIEEAWPIPRTQWTKFYLDPNCQLTPEKGQANDRLEFQALGDGLTFMTPPLRKEIEITGPMAAKLHISSSTEDADLFLVLRVFSPDFKEVTFQGALDPHTPISQGWLRASHRKLDPSLTLPCRPYHTHDEKQPLVPGQVYELDIEVWPTCIVIPKGHRIALSVRGRDYVYPGSSLKGSLAATQGASVPDREAAFTGCGPFLHDDPRDRPPSIFGGTTTIHFEKGTENYIILPIIP